MDRGGGLQGMERAAQPERNRELLTDLKRVKGKRRVSRGGGGARNGNLTRFPDPESRFRF